MTTEVLLQDFTKRRYYEIGDPSWEGWCVVSMSRGMVELMRADSHTNYFKKVDVDEFNSNWAYKDYRISFTDVEIK